MRWPSFRYVKVGERQHTMPFPLKPGWYVHGAVEEELTRLRKQQGGETLAYERRMKKTMTGASGVIWP
jgi:hypothetical protein